MKTKCVLVACLLAVLVLGMVPHMALAMGSSQTVASNPVAPKGTRLVVVETVTATWCGACAKEAAAMHQIDAEFSKDQVAIAEWHDIDGWEPEKTALNERAALYGIKYIPDVIFDGQDMVVGAPDQQTVHDWYKQNITKHMGIPGEVAITQSSSISGTDYQVDASIDAEQKSGTFTAYSLLVENVSVEDNGHWVDWVVRSQVVKQNVTLTAGQKTSVSGTKAVNATWKQDNLYFLTFVQDESTKVILNGNLAKLGSGGGGGDIKAPQLSNVQHSPTSPTDQDQVTVSATITDNVGVKAATLSYDDGSGAKSATMSGSGSTYSAKIGPFAVGKTITYHVEASDAAGNVGKSQAGSFTVVATADKTPPTITVVSNSPASPKDTDPVTITATITDNIGVTSAEVKYNDGSGSKSATMTASGSSYSANIGKFAGGATVTYHLEAKDGAGNLQKSPDATFSVQKTGQSQPPDVTVTDVKISPAYPKVGETVTITATVKNVGVGDASNVKVTFTIGLLKIDEKSVASLASGGSSTVTTTWVAQAEGSQSVKVEATVAGDSDTSNDAMAKTFIVAKTGGNGGSGSSGTSGSAVLLNWVLPLIIVVAIVVVALTLLARRKKPTPYPPYYQQDAFGGPQW
jgi:hypothetical protein